MKHIILAALLFTCVACSRYEKQVVVLTPAESAAFLAIQAGDDEYTWRKITKEHGADMKKVEHLLYLLSTGWMIREKSWDSKNMAVYLLAREKL